MNTASQAKPSAWTANLYQATSPGFSRYEIIHETLMQQVSKSEIESIEDQLIRQQALDFHEEDAQETVYRTDSETMEKRLLTFGIVIDYILTHSPEDSKPLLSRVFNEQYDKAEDGTITVRDKKLVSAKSVQNPNDPDAHYRIKAGKKVKGFSTNITETCDEENKPKLVTDVEVGGATTASRQLSSNTASTRGTTRQDIADLSSTRCRHLHVVHGLMCADFCCLTSK